MSSIAMIYPDFGLALAACGDGYNDSDIADVVAFKATVPLDAAKHLPEQAFNTIVSVGIAASDIPDRPLSVLDFGGGCGFHYFRAKRAFKASLNWALVESETMAARAAEVSSGHFSTHTSVASAKTALGQVDLVHTSGSLQYVCDPLATLKELLSIQASYFALARFPVWHGATVVGLQESNLSDNGIGPMPAHIPNRQVRYPITFTDFGDVSRLISDHDYEVLFTLGSPSAEYTIWKELARGITLICRLRSVK
jgi:putative methyltransferase (TIGR04325 family)